MVRPRSYPYQLLGACCFVLAATFLVMPRVGAQTMAASPAAQGDSARTELVQWIASIGTLQASMVQRIFVDGVLLEESQGSFAMQAPHMRWEVTAPFPQILLLNDRQLQIYDADLAQLTLHDLGGDNAPLPGDLLMRPEQLANGDYLVTREQDDARVSYRLIPKASSTLFQAIDVTVKAGQLESLVIYDWQGQQTQMIFTQVQINQPIAPALFQLDVPEGTDVIHG